MSSLAEANEEDALIEAAIQQESPLPAGRWAAFSHRNFTIFWLSLIVTNTGTWMASVAEGWLITDLEPDRKPFYLGLIALAFAIPMMLLPPFGGVVADRLPKMTGLRITQVAFLVVNSGVAILALTGHISVPILVVAAFLGAVVLAFDSPIRHSMVPDLVPRAQLTSAVSINAVAFTGAGLIGPAIGGLLIPLISPSGVFVVNALSSVSVLVALRLMHNVPDSGRANRGHGPESTRTSLARAWAFLRENKLVFGLFALALVAGLFGRSYGPLLPVLSRDVYRVGSTANGILISAAGLGALAGGLLLSAYASDLHQRGRLVVALLLTQGVLLAIMAIFDQYLVGFVTLAGMGACGAAAVALIMTLVQENAPPELRGRVMGFFLLTTISFPSAGSFFLGLVADRTSIQSALIASAVVVILGCATIAARNGHVLAVK